jgi:DNA-directed RNA polymerase subunit RPC12/RpoP
MNDRIVTFESYSDPMLAEIIKGRLEANGIDCYIADGNTIGANPLYNNALGGVKIKVFEHDIEKCKAILAESEDLQLSEESPVLSDTNCPYCGSNNVRYGAATIRKTNFFGALISFLSMTYPFIARNAWHCFNCGKEFE